MQNYKYDDAAQTFNKIRNYKDVMTNDLFVGARLLALPVLSFTQTETQGYFSVTSVSITYKFIPNELKYSFTGMTMNIFSSSVGEPTSLEETWNYRFEGRDIYYQNDAGQYVYGGTIGAISQPAEGETSGTVNLTLDLPGAMKIANTTFNYTLSS